MGPPGGPAQTSSPRVDPAPAILTARGISCRFGDRQVVSDLDFDLHEGELVALVGENGAGKTTLIRCLAGALTPASGEVRFSTSGHAGSQNGQHRAGAAVVWQDLALCDNLDAVSNLFLGQEWGRALLSDAQMYREARNVLADLQIDLPDLQTPVGLLSGGERQMIAIARALMSRPTVLLLDEPTAALSVRAARHVDDLLRRLHRSGLPMVLVSHEMDQVFALSDRIVVLRRGQVVADVSPVEVHPDDVVDLMAGIERESTARMQLHRLHSLVDQLAEVEPSASLPLIVSAIATAVGQSQVSVHLLEVVDDDGSAALVRRASVNLPEPLDQVTERLMIGPSGGPVGDAALTGRQVTVDDLRRLDAAPLIVEAARAAGVVAAWAVPILGPDGVLGVVSGWSTTTGRLQEEQLELVSLYAGHAAAAIERERLLQEVRRRNHLLETLRGVLETLAGPEHIRGGLRIALLALARGLGAQSVAVLERTPDGVACRASVTVGPSRSENGSGVTANDEVTVVPGGPAQPILADLVETAVRDAALVALDGPPRLDRARLVGSSAVAAPFDVPDGRAVLVAWWPENSGITSDSLDLLDDAARSIRLALEREALEVVNQEAQALRRSQAHQHDFLSRVSHELRTPLTAIRGYASSLNQTDITWDEEAQHRFLDLIATESARMGRLVGDLLDSSALDAGVFRLRGDWCELELVIQAAMACVPGATENVHLEIDPHLGPLWADHDRLEQVFVNLLENVVRHGDGLGGTRICARLAGDGAVVEVRVSDNGPGIPADLAEAVFQPQVRGATTASGEGLGLTISRGIVLAHGGQLGLEPSRSGTTMLLELPVEPIDEAGEITVGVVDA